MIIQTPQYYEGFPWWGNTGPVAGTVFTQTSGLISSSADNQIIENLYVSPGAIVINHFNCIVRNCIVNGSGNNISGFATFGIGANDSSNTNYNLRVLNCKVFSTVNVPVAVGDTTNIQKYQMFDGIRLAIEIGYCDISGCENAIDISWSAVGASYIHDNYIHDLQVWDSTYAPPDGSHVDGLQTYDISGSGGMTIRHNTVEGWQDTGSGPHGGASSCLAFITNQHDLTVDNNLFAGGSYSLYGPSQGGGGTHPVNVRVVNNHFSTKFYPTCGAFGTYSGWDNTASGFEWAGNVWHDGPSVGQPVPFQFPWPN